MIRDAEATKKRILEAALQEFATHGIAGARVDKIAEIARSNKAQIYYYFGNKEGLFDAVFNALCVEGLRATPIDITDLPGYAGHLFDNFEDHPEIARLTTWYRLERAGSAEPLTIVLESLQGKANTIAQAQQAGLLSSHYAPADLLGLILHLSMLWASATPEFEVLISGQSRSHRRKVVTDAVRGLLTQ
ncbi:TetR family transcriptional regulator [Ktedonospora formicarum]|nr:TetR family transcriptional regulator [Ktedonospora formicarum]